MAQVPLKICNLCSKENSIHYCYECRHALCRFCRQKHDKISATAGHTLTNMCATSVHKDHSFADVDEIVADEKKDANGVIIKPYQEETICGKCEIQFKENEILRKENQELQLRLKEMIAKAEKAKENQHDQNYIGLPGLWRGTYKEHGASYPFKINIFFTNKKQFHGNGSDDIDDFTISGYYGKNDSISFKKQYTGAHSVDYSGRLSAGGKYMDGRYTIGIVSDTFSMCLDVQ